MKAVQMVPQTEDDTQKLNNAVAGLNQVIDHLSEMANEYISKMDPKIKAILESNVKITTNTGKECVNILITGLNSRDAIIKAKLAPVPVPNGPEA